MKTVYCHFHSFEEDRKISPGDSFCQSKAQSLVSKTVLGKTCSKLYMRKPSLYKKAIMVPMDFFLLQFFDGDRQVSSSSKEKALIPGELLLTRILTIQWWKLRALSEWMMAQLSQGWRWLAQWGKALAS